MVKKRLPRSLVWSARLLLAGVVLLVLLYLVSNLFLATKPGQSFVQKQLTRRAPTLVWTHESLAWSPWRGITIKKLEARLKAYPEAPPLLQLEEGVLRPYWRESLRGRRAIRELSLSRPTINLPIEAFLVSLPAQPAPEPELAAPAPPTAPTAPPLEGEPHPNPPKEKTASPPKPTPRPEEKPTPAAPPKPEAEKKPPPPAPAAPKPPPEDPRFWLRLQDAEIRFYSFSSSQSAALKGLNIDLPLAGPPTKGSLSWKQILLNKTEIAGMAELQVDWKNPSWTLPPQSIELKKPSQSPEATGFELQVGGELAIRAKGRPFRFQSYFPPQSLPETLLHRESGLSTAFTQASASFRSGGRLSDPMSWQFDSLAAANEVQIYSQLRGEHFTFDTAQAQFFLRQGVVQAPLIALRSEQQSLIANGQLSLLGSVLGVVRAVVAPEIEESITQIAIGSFLSRGHTNHWFLPLGTPDRYYRDFHIEGTLPDPQINLGRHYEFMKLSQALEIMRRFYLQEVNEEPRLAP